MLFVPCSIGRQRNPLALALKKSVALQLRQQSLAGVAPVLSGSGTSVTMSSVGWTLPMVVPMPLVGLVDAGAQRAPSEVAKQPAMAVILLWMMGRMGLPT